MIKNLCFIALALLFSQIVYGQSKSSFEKSNANVAQSKPDSQSQNQYRNLKTQAEQVGAAFVSEDFGKVVDSTYPRLVEMLGGRAKMISFLEQNKKQWDSEGIKITSFTVDEPKEILRIDKQLFAILPATMKIKVPEGTLVGKSYMIAITDDNGGKWTFVDANRRSNEEMLRTLFPSAAGKLQIPETKPPILYP
ncbi:MAG: hypothetical protein NVSMB56_10000 [Pyrinomonadaceae bacterium]